jgi:maltooligosyltrehalose trehalohydrolase
MEATKLARRLPVGAEVLAGDGGGVHFRVWAPRRRRVEVVLEDGGGAAFGLEREGEGGYFSAPVGRTAAGALYRFRLDGDE